MRPVETIPGLGEGEDKGDWWRGVISTMIYLIYCYIARTFVNATMLPQHKKTKYKKQTRKQCSKLNDLPWFIWDCCTRCTTGIQMPSHLSQSWNCPSALTVPSNSILFLPSVRAETRRLRFGSSLFHCFVHGHGWPWKHQECWFGVTNKF
jgi:hypothetical protein